MKSKQSMYKLKVHLFVSIQTVEFFSKDGIDFGSKLLLESINFSNQDQSIIDMGCGYGPMGIFAAKMNPQAIIHMVDINERAIELARKKCDTQPNK